MSSRQVKAAIKKYGVGPSHATIHNYVVNCGGINVPPLKRGPVGHILELAAYKTLCTAFATFMQINQLNCPTGINKQGKMAPLGAKAMMVDVDGAIEIIKRPTWDIAIDLSNGKLNLAKEWRVC